MGGQNLHQVPQSKTPYSWGSILHHRAERKSVHHLYPVSERAGCWKSCAFMAAQVRSVGMAFMQTQTAKVKQHKAKTASGNDYE